MYTTLIEMIVVGILIETVVSHHNNEIIKKKNINE